ncbi:exopolysaccharide biosynthesis operon protein EpsL [Methylotenera mobilis JLW8]|uniref:Exopolysaccharide biosynthesis operon protein EpsL n=1 Tax=Methylotenera mobilis (strain JLW8 / ATCC BAA-1282 / DSM 17540) TaxID=583345 RepID=C6WXQ3_METML|nr:exopolysaccharide biosynthesis operon protein EpsL [Methylotenera mobilis JLW8]
MLQNDVGADLITNLLSSKLKLVLFAVFFSPVLVFADEQDVFNVIAGVNRQYDNNLFRTSASEQSDQITTSFAGIRVDKPYSLQRFKFDLTQTAYRYQKADYLDFDATEYKAAWLWALTPYLTGNLSANRAQSLNSFTDYTNQKLQNIRTTETRRFDADWSPYGNWHLLAGLTHYTLENGQVFQAESDYTQNSVDAGVKYVYRSGTTTSLIMHDKKGVYDNRALNASNLSDTGFDEREVEAGLNWILSGKSRLDVKASYVDRNHDHFSQRDYARPAGSVIFVWTPTGKIKVSVNASRQVASFQTNYSSYTTRDTLMLSPTWAITNKINIQASAGIARRSFDGQSVVANTDREDTEKSVSLGVNWTPLRSVTIGANLQHSKRDSSLQNFDYKDTAASISSQLFF